MRSIATNIGGMLFEGDGTLTGIVSYFTSIVAIAIIGVVVTSVITDPQISRLVRTVTGVLVLLVLLHPLLHGDLEELATTVQEALSRDVITEDYEALYQRKLREQIATTTETYILEKAASIGAQIQVEVELDQNSYPTPNKVEITGKLTPQQKELLEEYLTLQLGIAPQNQRWNVYD